MFAHGYRERLARRTRGRRVGEARGLGGGEEEEASCWPLSDKRDTQERLHTIRRVRATRGCLPRQSSVPPPTAQRPATFGCEYLVTPRAIAPGGLRFHNASRLILQEESAGEVSEQPRTKARGNVEDFVRRLHGLEVLDHLAHEGQLAVTPL